MKLTIFEQLVIYLMRKSQKLEITTGLAYGHKRMHIGNFEIESRATEAEDGGVIASNNDITMTLKTFAEACKFVDSIHK